MRDRSKNAVVQSFYRPHNASCPSVFHLSVLYFACRASETSRKKHIYRRCLLNRIFVANHKPPVKRHKCIITYYVHMKLIDRFYTFKNVNFDNMVSSVHQCSYVCFVIKTKFCYFYFVQNVLCTKCLMSFSAEKYSPVCVQ